MSKEEPNNPYVVISVKLTEKTSFNNLKRQLKIQEKIPTEATDTEVLKYLLELAGAQ